MTKTINNENNTQRILPPCDALHPVTIRFYEPVDSYADFDIEGVFFVTFIDYEDMQSYCKHYPDYQVIETGHN